MRAVDTNVLVRLLTGDDLKQAAAEVFVAPGAWISHLVLFEAMSVLDSVYARPPASIARSIQMLLEHDTLILQDSDTIKSALTHSLLGLASAFRIALSSKPHARLGTSRSEASTSRSRSYPTRRSFSGLPTKGIAPLEGGCKTEVSRRLFQHPRPAKALLRPVSAAFADHRRFC